MGLYDHVHVDDERFVCSEGHPLSGEEFQSKDFGCTMGDVSVSGGRVGFAPGEWGDGPVERPLLGRFCIYTTCKKCPAFVQAHTCNLCDMSVEFVIEVIDDAIRKVTRVGPTTAEWLRDEPKKPYMDGARGPMPWAEAQHEHIHGTRSPWPKEKRLA